MVGWDNIRLTTLHRPEFQPLTGKTLAEAARLLGLEPVDCLCHVLAEEACNVTMIDFITCNEDIGRILRAPFASVISDSLYPTEGLPHPRVYGTFTRILETFVRERHVLTLPEAVQRMTALPAQALRLQARDASPPGWTLMSMFSTSPPCTSAPPGSSPRRRARAWTPCSSAAHLPSCTEPLRARQTGRCCEENSWTIAGLYGRIRSNSQERNRYI